MPETRNPRPAQVTIAGWLVMAGSVFLVLTAFDQIAGLRSLETRGVVEEFLSRPPGSDLGLGLQAALDLLRVLTMVAAACATAAAILGFHVLRRSRSARLGLTLLAPPLFLVGIAVGEFQPAVGFLSAMVAGSVVMLWFQPARDWVDGRTPPPAPAPRVAPPPQREAPPEVPAAPPSEPRAYPGFGAAPGGQPAPGSQPAPGGPPGPLTYAVPPVHHAPTAHYPPPVRPTRPPALMWACGLAWAGSAIVVVVMLLSVTMVLAAPDALMDEVYRQNPDLSSEGITRSDLRSTIIVVGSALVVWSAVAAVLAAFAWRGRPWAWTALLASACGASLLCLVTALGSPVMLASLALCAPAIPLLLRPEVRAFVRRAPR